jgi:site-specific DNA-methyltransferase (adenine-specific)
MTPYYADESVTLYHGDCREIAKWLTADVLVTDPPYGIAWSKGQNNAAKSTAHSGIENDQDTSCRDEILRLWGDRPGIVFGAWGAPFPAYKQALVWRKPVDAGVVGSTTGYRRDTELIFLTGPWPVRTSSRSSVLETDFGKARYLNTHPHAKPPYLMEQLMEWTSGVVADPFAGSGTTLVAAKQMGRKAIGVELKEQYCELAASRLSQDVLDFGEAS